MKIRVHMTSGDMRRLLLYRYFFLMKMKFIRWFGGPLVVLLGSFLLIVDLAEYPFLDKVGTYLGSFAIGFGIYFMLRPFIALLIGKNFKEETADYELREKGLGIEEAKGFKTELPYTLIRSCETIKDKLVIRFVNKPNAILVVYLDKVIEGDGVEFGKALEAKIAGQTQA